MSFFEQWWTHLNNQTRQLVKRFAISKYTIIICVQNIRLLEKGQFEIVTGGWVMSDEANSHYYSIIMELFEGHEFLFNNLGKYAAKYLYLWSQFVFALICLMSLIDYIPTNHWAIGILNNFLQFYILIKSNRSFWTESNNRLSFK